MQTDPTTLVFRALADPTRRRILEAIGSQPSHVAQLAQQFPMSRPAISKHLGVLKNAGLVSFFRTGKAARVPRRTCTAAVCGRVA